MEEPEIQLVVFKMGDEEYGLDVHAVKEIIRVEPTTRIPRAPNWVLGVLNLRGQIITVIDLRAKLGLPVAEEDEETRTIIIEVDREILGALVDAVVEVTRLPVASVEPASSLLAEKELEGLVTGIARVDERLIIILAADLILSWRPDGETPLEASN